MTDDRKAAEIDEVYLTPEELSARWRHQVCPDTLKNWRSAGKGPSYTKIGRAILYPVTAVKAHEREHTVS